MSEQSSTKQSTVIYNDWFASLDDVDQELVNKVRFTNDDDYPIQIVGALSPAAKERGRYFELEKGYWIVAYYPTPPEAYFETLKQEEAEEQARKDQEAKDAYAHRQAERARMKAFTESLSEQGYICTCRWDIKTEPGKGEAIRFDTKNFGTGNRFTPRTFEGQTVWEESYDNARQVWMPANLAERLYREKWEQDFAEKGGAFAFRALGRIITGLDCYGDDYYAWIEQNIGTDQLVAYAKAAAPIEKPQGSSEDALVSKYYRIPVRMETWPEKHLPGQKTYVVGYGNTRVWTRERGRSDESWNKHLRTAAWVPLGEEDDPKHLWPTQEDIQERQEASMSHAAFFDNL